MTPQRFDAIAAVYDETRGGEERGRRFAARLLPYLDAGRPVAEIGVGTGLVAAALRDAGLRVAGFDISTPMLARAVDRLGPVVACADAMRLPVAGGAIAQAVSVWLLHVTDAAGVLREAARVIEPGGRFLVVGSSNAAVTDDDMGPIVRRMWIAFDPAFAEGRDGEIALRRLAPPLGFDVETVERIEYPFTESPAEHAGKIERRVYSILQDATPEQWRAYVEPVVEALRALPEPGRARSRVATHDLVVLRRVP